MPVMQFYAVDPGTGRELKIKNVHEYAAECYELIRRCVKENEENRGKQGDARFIVCGIHKEKGHHVWFNFLCHEPKRGIVCSSPRAAYAGHQGQAEILMSGKWRLATADEEIACRQRDEDKAANKMREREKKAGELQAQQFQRMAQAVMGAVQAPAPAPVQVTTVLSTEANQIQPDYEPAVPAETTPAEVPAPVASNAPEVTPSATAAAATPKAKGKKTK